MADAGVDVEPGANSDTLPAAAAALAGGKVSKAGDTMTGPLVLPGAPTEDLHAVTKQYVDRLGLCVVGGKLCITYNQG